MMKKLAVVSFCLWIAAWGNASAEDGLLRVDNEPGFWSGFLFFGLSAATLVQTQKEYQLSRDAKANADTSYGKYQAAATAQDAQTYRAETESYHNEARWREKRTNVGLFIGVSFFLAGVWAWLPEDWQPNASILATNDGILFTRTF
ncbi:MAG: hypothetical protein OEW12_03895 [Deltaproteobacteria bacterium]|nr:hypothetical protein [Deltaproteobacteria bacterium]